MKENLHKDMDQFFKKKFNNREFEFKEAYWAEMTDLLEEETERKAVGFPFWKWILSGIALLVIGATVWSFTPTSIDQTIHQSTVQPVRNTSNIDVLSIRPNSASPTITGKTVGEINVTRQVIEQNSQENKVEQESIQVIDNILKETKTNTKDRLQQPIPSNVEKKSLKNQPPVKPSSNTQRTPFEQILPDFKTTPFNNQLPIPMKIEEEKPQASSDIFAETKQVEVKPYLGESLTSLEGFVEEESPTFEDLKYPLNVKSNQWKFGILAGLNTAQDYGELNSEMTSYTTQPIVGLTTTYTPHPNWSVNSGILYHARGGVNTTYTIDSIFYTFGVSNNRTEIDVTTLHYIEIPLQVGYNFGKRKNHQLTAGVAYAYLMNAQGTSTSLQTVVANSVDANSAYTATAERTSSGFQSAFMPHDLSVQMGYNVEVHKSIKIGISANYGLVNVGFGFEDQSPGLADVFVNSPPVPIKNIYFRAALTYDLANF